MYITKNHYAITSAIDVYQVCQPLFDSTKFVYFSYFKEFSDGSRILLSTNAEWTHFLYNQEYVAITEFDPKPTKEQKPGSKTGNFLWEWLPNLLPSEELKEKFSKKIVDSKKFNINNGISVIKQSGTDFEYFNFGTAEPSAYIYQFYFDNIDLLNRFIVYFKIKASLIIEASNSNKIIIPKKSIITPDTLNPMDQNKAHLSSFIKETSIKKYPIFHNGKKTHISNRQLQCLYHLSCGKSAKEIAQQVNISYRTVEKHLQLLKEKFLLSTKSDLLKFSATPQMREYFAFQQEIE